MRPLTRAIIASVAVLSALVLGVTAVAPANATSASSFVTLLGQLPTDNGYHSGYVRSLFKHWIDANHNGCDTRAEVLIAESTVRTTRSSSCSVKTGRWVSAYDGAVVTTASKLDIDHMVPLAEAWRSGAYKWTAARRQAYANDLGYAYSLNAVTAAANRQKSDSDPSGWLPSLKSARCAYVAEWISVKWRWGLSVDSLERGVLRTLLSKCANIGVALPTRA